MIEYNNLPNFILRRIDFLLQEAKEKSPKDQVITYVMRVLSNYSTVGFDGNSLKIKSHNHRLSEKAVCLLNNSSTLSAWALLCINEHKKPLKEIWEHIIEQSSVIRPIEIWEIFLKSPMVTITKEEDLHLSKKRLRSQSGNSDRYSLSGINVVHLETTPVSFLLNKR